jgi:hypothetical protein
VVAAVAVPDKIPVAVTPPVTKARRKEKKRRAISKMNANTRSLHWVLIKACPRATSFVFVTTLFYLASCSFKPQFWGFDYNLFGLKRAGV